MIKVWQSFSCNNSAAYRLVARFPDAAVAAEVAAELDEFLVAQERVGGYGRRSGALATLARTYGDPDWLDNSSGELGVFAQDATLVVYHTMCLGLGPGPAAFLEDRGGTPERASAADLQLSVLFRVDPTGERDDEIATLFAALVDGSLKKTPWARFAPANVVWFRDPKTIGLCLPIQASGVVAFKAWLGIEDAVYRIDQHDDRDLFSALAAARCTSCNRKLGYLDPRLYDIETPQLMCGCGGLYELSTFYSP